MRMQVSRRDVLSSGAAVGALSLLGGTAQALPGDERGAFPDAASLKSFWKMHDMEMAMQKLPDILPRIPGPAGPRQVMFVNTRGGGWLPELARWAGPRGSVVTTSFGTDSRGEVWEDAGTKEVAKRYGLDNLAFKTASAAEMAAGYDLVVACRALYKVKHENWGSVIARARQSVKPGGTLMFVEYDYRTWHNAPRMEALDFLHTNIGPLTTAATGKEFNAHDLPGLFVALGMEPSIHGDVTALPPGNKLSTTSIESAGPTRGVAKHLRAKFGDAKVDEMRRAAEIEAKAPFLWVLSPMVVSVWGTVAG